MEWIKISANKLKIMLTAEDARHYDLDCNTSGSSDMATRAAFREILSDVCRETGFDTRQEETYIQMYPSKEGGCELFITKMGLLFTGDREWKATKKEHLRSARIRLSCRDQAFLFEEMNAMLLGCRSLLRNTLVADSRAFRDDSSHFWLILTPQEDHEDGQFGILSDFGREVPFEAASTFLREHGKTLCDSGAIQTLGALI